MIARGNPWELKRQPKNGALHFDTNGNMLYAGEETSAGHAGSLWVMLCHSKHRAGVSQFRNCQRPQVCGCKELGIDVRKTLRVKARHQPVNGSMSAIESWC